MNRGQVYFNHYHDSTGRERRIPVLIVSTNEYNDNADFVTVVRVIRNKHETIKGPNVYIPAAAFTETSILSDCYALAETIGSVRKANMEGPIGVLASNYYMDGIVDAIKQQVGAIPLRPTTDKNEKGIVAGAGPMGSGKEAPWYSAAFDMNHRGTKPEKEGAQ